MGFELDMTYIQPMYSENASMQKDRVNPLLVHFLFKRLRHSDFVTQF